MGIRSGINIDFIFIKNFVFESMNVFDYQTRLLEEVDF